MLRRAILIRRHMLHRPESIIPFTDGSNILYLRNPDQVEAISTNSDIYSKSLDRGNRKTITVGMNGYDVSPIYTPDGKYLSF